MHHLRFSLLPRRTRLRFVSLFFVGVFVFGITVLTPAPVFAADSTQETLAKLVEQIRVLQAQLTALQKRETPAVKEIPTVSFFDEDTPPATPAYTFSRDLSFGLRNDPDVTNLQEFLIDQGFLQGSPSGNYFILTQKAVKKFQAAYNIKASGYFGPVTRALANRILAGTESAGAGGGGSVPIGTGGGGSGTGPGGINNAPQINGFPAVSATVEPGHEVSFSWHASDADNDTLSWSIDWGDGSGMAGACAVSLPIRNGATAGKINTAEPAGWAFVQAHTWPTVGSYTVKATVSDCKGGTNAHIFVVSVGGARENLPPVIYGLKAPTALRVGETGTWTIKASDPENGPLSYTAFWGDEESKPAPPSLPLSLRSVRQTTTFTHVYGRAGTFNPVFAVYDNAGLSNETSASVSVRAISNFVDLIANTQYDTDKSGVFVSASIKGSAHNKSVYYWKTNISCGSGVSVSGKNEENLCGTEKTLYGYNYYDVTRDNLIWTVGAKNSSPERSSVTFSLQAYNSANTMIGSDKEVISLEPKIASSAMRITAPNGGEVWQLNSLHTITWTPYDPNSGVNSAKEVRAYLERLVNGQYQVAGKIIESGKASIHWIGELDKYGNYAEPGEYYVRVVNSQTGESDRSDKPFNLVAQNTVKADLKINGSDGPVALSAGGGTVTFFWTSQNADTCKIYMNGMAGDVMNLPSSGKKDLFLKQNPYSVQLGVSLSCESSIGGASDTVYISPYAGEGSYTTITSPNGGENLSLSSAYSINWVFSSDINKVSIALYKNDAFFKWIVTDVPWSGPGVLSWNPSSVISNSDIGGQVFKIYIIGYKSGGGTVEDKSDAPFSIVAGTASNQLSVVYASGNKSSYGAGEKINLVIKGVELFDGSPGEPGEGLNVQVHLQGVNDGYSLQGYNARYNAQTGYWEAYAFAPADASKTYKIDSAFYCSNSSLACGKRYTSAFQQVNAAFTFGVSGTGKQPVMAVSPNGGESYQAGATTQMPLKWSADCGYTSFQLLLVKGNMVVETINNSVPAGVCSSGQSAVPYYTTWQIPSTLSPGADYKLLINGMSGDGNSVGDDSDAPFSVTRSAPSQTAYDLKVRNAYLVVNNIPAESPGFRNPLADEDFQVKVTVENASGKGDSVYGPTARLNIYNASGVSVYSVGTGVDSALLAQGPTDVVFKSDLFIPNISTATLRFPAGTYRAVADVVGVSNNDPNPSNDSLTFTITVDPPVSASPVVLAPNGGESLTIGSPYDVRWRSPSANFDADVSLVVSGFAQAYPIYYTTAPTAGDVPNRWTVGNLASGTRISPGSYYVKICQRSTTNCDQSDAAFTIVGP